MSECGDKKISGGGGESAMDDATGIPFVLKLVCEWFCKTQSLLVVGVEGPKLFDTFNAFRKSYLCILKQNFITEVFVDYLI